ncbi:MAG: NAD(P)/FAD-dependent oxidoreductase [Oligoflexia bacterium]|nr:NAD(P)/FAD-dependent oxidoreductase [Oligoflexia bacterium]MBF0367442.1 NAD(P)/FAD-dependent oxidoreductase [Oligoflexia bacterium]
MLHLPVVIIGAGVTGLAIAREVALKTNYEMVLFEKERFVGHHTSSRNSGVIHAGLYYERGGLKHKFCIEGNRLWDEFAHTLDVPLKRCGKFIIASNDEELSRIDVLFAKAQGNGARVRFANEAELRELREYAIVKRAFLSLDTAIVDTSSLLCSLADDLYKRGVPIMLSHEVHNIRQEGELFIIKAAAEEISSNILINAGGPFAVSIRKMLGLHDLESIWVKGNYLKTRTPFYRKHLIYPVPPRDDKILGVHSTFDFQGDLRFGPDAEDINLDQQSFSYEVSPATKERMWPHIAMRFPTISYEELALDYAGIRPRIGHNGSKYNDFWIKSQTVANYIELCGVESPGLTSAPAIAKHIAALVATMMEKR